MGSGSGSAFTGADGVTDGRTQSPAAERAMACPIAASYVPPFPLPPPPCAAQHIPVVHVPDVISAPEVTRRRIAARDQFVILATDGVWDVVSNEEAVHIVAATPDREKAVKRLVQCVVHAWRHKRRGYAVDDCSAICLFLHSRPS
ncbi:probable protein phosphatase 2C 48 [Triticum dicoccoides]|uniref:probable protein phosphatase 2C 48 n=1 Tax=Triticum dicoccoides TaxID=85692 RepID=UPI0018907A20|nr:probable protein phosphatase 2C 48 [Triticum dicoccoides]